MTVDHGIFVERLAYASKMLRGRAFVLALAGYSAFACSPEFSSRDATAGAPATAGGNAGNAGGRSGDAALGGGASPTGGSSPTPLTGGSGGQSGSNSETGPSEGGAASLGQGGEDDTGGSSTSGGSGSGTGGSTGNDGGSSAGPNSGGTGGGGTGASGGAASGATGAGTGGTSNMAGTGGEVIGGCDNQLLANANFDAGPTSSWREETEWPGLDIIMQSDDPDLVETGVTPHSGDFLAWLGGVPDNEYDAYRVILRQDVAIPPDASTLTLSGYYWITTLDEPDVVYDEAYLEFEDDDGTTWQALPLTNVDYTDGWVPFEASTSELDRMGGRTVTFVAYSRTDPMGITSFFLDSLRLEAGCGR